ncbi:GIN domain-containing protein [Spirosoma arcticum]
MKKSLKIEIAVCLTIAAGLTQAQTPQTLPSFDKVIASPHVSVVLVAGERESIRLAYQNVAPEKVNYVVRHNTLRIYLDDARITDKQRKWKEGDHDYNRSVYDRDVKVTAYITYRQLKSLQLRGEEEATCRDELISDAFRLRVYGQATVTLTSLKTNVLKAKLYGENKVTIMSGQADRQQYRIYGENRLDTESLTGKTVSAHAYGDSQLRVYASDRMGVMAFGESNIRYAGGASLHKGLVVGEVTIRRTE